MTEPMTCQNCFYREYDPGYPPCEDCLADKWKIGKLSKWCGAIWEDKNFSNADRIRAMSDEELAEFISDKARTFGEEYEGYMSALDWLKEEVEE